MHFSFLLFVLIVHPSAYKCFPCIFVKHQRAIIRPRGWNPSVPPMQSIRYLLLSHVFMVCAITSMQSAICMTNSVNWQTKLWSLDGNSEKFLCLWRGRSHVWEKFSKMSHSSVLASEVKFPTSPQRLNLRPLTRVLVRNFENSTMLKNDWTKHISARLQIRLAGK